MNVCMYVSMHVITNMYMYVFVHICIYVCVYRYVAMYICICVHVWVYVFIYVYIYIYVCTYTGCHKGMYQISGGVPYVNVYRYKPKHVRPNLNVYGDNGHGKVSSSCGSTFCTRQLTVLYISVLVICVT